MDRIYHGCGLKYSNGANTIIGGNEKCLIPTKKCFWKDPRDVINTVNARWQLKKQPTAHYKTIEKYLEQRVKKIIKDQLAIFEEKAVESTRQLMGDQKRTKK